MSAGSPVTVTPLARAQMAIAATVLSHAFLTQPNNVAVWGRQDESARRAIESFFTAAKLRRPVSKALAAHQNGKLVGVLNMAAWPDCQLPGREMLRLMPLMLRLFKGKVLRALAIPSAWARHHPRQVHWHLGPVGVLPECQGQGIGSRLLAGCCAIIDEQHAAGYLETDRPENVPFYERFCFEVTGERLVLGVPNWFMWRAPRPVSG